MALQAIAKHRHPVQSAVNFHSFEAMDFESEKKLLAHYILQTQDKELIRKIRKLVDPSEPVDMDTLLKPTPKQPRLKVGVFD